MRTYTVPAILVRDIVYSKDGKNILVPKDTLVKVDVEKNVVFIDNDHIEVQKHEYKPYFH